jgi:transposase
MGKRARRNFTPEFKAEAVKLAREGKAAGKSLEAIANDIGVWPATLGDWLRRSKTPDDPVKEAPATTAREQELLKENRLLRMERDILKKAAAFFAKEST